MPDQMSVKQIRQIGSQKETAIWRVCPRTPTIRDYKATAAATNEAVDVDHVCLHVHLHVHIWMLDIYNTKVGTWGGRREHVSNILL